MKTKEGKFYFKKFGIEATIETLKDAAGYTTDEIWLFSVELFAKEVQKFNMKGVADSKEVEAEYEHQKAVYEAKNKVKK